MKKSLLLPLISLLFPLFFGFAFPVQAAFSDLSERHLYAPAITTLVSREIIHGYPDGSFRAEQLINRAEFVHLLSEAFFPDQEAPARCFSDVDARAWFSDSVCRAKAKGLVRGYSNGRFEGVRAITFAEASQILYHLREASPLPAPDDFWFAPAVQFMSDHHAIPISVAELHDELTRGEAAFMIAQLLSPQTEARSRVYTNGVLQEDQNQISLMQLRAAWLSTEQEAFLSSEAETPETSSSEGGESASDSPRRRRRGAGVPTPVENTSEDTGMSQENTGEDSFASNSFRRATWIWNHGSSTPQEYVQMTLNEAMTDVYLSSYDPDWAGEYIALLHQADDAISVQLIAEGACALEIDPTCGTQHLTVYSTPQQVKDYVKLDQVNAWLATNSPGLQVQGIHYDVEAYHGPGTFWQCENEGTYGKCTIDNYLSMVQHVMIPLYQEGLSQSVVWGSSRNTTPDTGSSYAADFQRLITNAQYQTAIDDIVILAYHDQESVSDVAEAFQVANAVCTGNCPGIFPALETEDIGIDVVSFAEEGRAAADAALQAHIDAYGSSDSFAGVGVHWLKTYHEMN